MSCRTKAIAQKKGKALQNKLINTTKGKWKVRVHKNGSWYYNAYLGSIRVDEYRGSLGIIYTAMIGEEKNSPGTALGIWHNPLEYDTPEKAVYECMKMAQTVVDGYVEMLNDNIKKLPKYEGENTRG